MPKQRRYVLVNTSRLTHNSIEAAMKYARELSEGDNEEIRFTVAEVVGVIETQDRTPPTRYDAKFFPHKK